ncbi:hypothetical protein BGZ61DRAFT_115076 [Ilyonectria robusta]|uniref:uncharacterized protein n=1 Tax=Ilyonectria robusta TaxID=1079257 RepID=UPI001E8DD089|nr:uncharacterized protein BGZ61DRAFT_115076 [Ilyonectria robusta]KAH8670079.1 hypothetical protein BGZ61DRAFT_115076 [Ilyonectria robusta]
MGPTKYTARSVLETFYDEERRYMSAPPEERDFSGIAALLAPNFSLEQTSALPYAGVFTGAEGMQDWIRRMADYFDVVDVKSPEIFEQQGSGRIVVLSNVHFRVRKTGEDLVFPFCQAVTVDLENGTMVHMRPFYWDVQEVNRALGYKP